MRIAVLSLLLAGASPLLAAVPKVDSIFPAGGQQGSEFEVSVAGQLEPWPLAATCDEPRIQFTPDEKEKGKFRVVVAGEVDPGAYLVWFSNNDGVSLPRLFVIGLEAELEQAGPEPMLVPVENLPLTVNGRLESGGDVDRFSIALDAGQRLVASVAGYAIDSPIDPLLHMRGPAGEALAFNHDASQLSLDPRLVFVAPAGGAYELQLSAFAYPPQANIRFAGGATSIYRLTLGREAGEIDLPAPLEGGGEEPQPITVPSSISGRIDPVGDVDRFQFEAKNGEVLHFEVEAAQLGSWMDALLVIEDSAGKELVRQDDIDSKKQLDVSLDWTAPADGSYVAAVSDLNGAGGSEIAYRLLLSRAEPGFSADAATGVFAVRAGEKLEIAVSVTRHHGYVGELEIGIDGLREGVSAAPVAVPEKGGEVKLSVEAGVDATVGPAPISIWVAAKGAPPEARVPCDFQLKGGFADSGDLLVNRTTRGWLSVLERKKDGE